MTIEYKISLAGVVVHPKEGRNGGGFVATFSVDQPGRDWDPRLPSRFELPVTLAAGFFADKDAVEVMQARLALMAEALVAATSDWKRDAAWFDERRLEPVKD